MILDFEHKREGTTERFVRASSQAELARLYESFLIIQRRGAADGFLVRA